MTYSEKLKDPRWQRKRLEVLQRDNWTCTCCGANDITLHVHHFCYSKSFNPWEISVDNLTTLCEDCHHITSIKDLPPAIDDILMVITAAANSVNEEKGTMSIFYRRWIIRLLLNRYPKVSTYAK